MEPGEVEAVVRLAARRGWVVLFDECYDRFVFEGRHQSAAAFAAEFPETVLVAGTLSKTYAMTGWRVGYALAARPLVDVMGRIVSHATSNVCSVAQKAAFAALDNRAEANAAIAAMLAEYARRREFLIPALNALPGVTCAPPGGTFYAFPDVSAHFGRTIAGVEVTGLRFLREGAPRRGRGGRDARSRVRRGPVHSDLLRDVARTARGGAEEAARRPGRDLRAAQR